MHVDHQGEVVVVVVAAMVTEAVVLHLSQCGLISKTYQCACYCTYSYTC